MATKKQYDELLGQLKKTTLMKDKKFTNYGITFRQLLFYDKYGIRIPNYIDRRLEITHIVTSYFISCIILIIILLITPLIVKVHPKFQAQLKSIVCEYFVFPYLAVLLLFLFVLTIVFLFPRQRSE